MCIEFDPRDAVSIPTGIFKDEPACKDSDVTFTFAIFNKGCEP